MKTYLLIALGAVVVVGGGYFAWQGMGASAPASQEQTTNTNTETAEESLSGTGTFASLMARGGSYECTMSIAVQNSESEGTVYISGDQISGHFTSRANGATYTGHMIVTGGYAYSWSDVMPQGFKSKTTVTSQGGTQVGGFDVNTNTQYDCKPWAADQSKFVVPTNITFMETPGQ